jgi:hypothetical protein
MLALFNLNMDYQKRKQANEKCRENFGEGYEYKGADTFMGNPMCWNPTTGERKTFTRSEAVNNYAPNWIIPNKWVGGKKQKTKNKKTKKYKKKQKKTKKNKK